MGGGGDNIMGTYESIYGWYMQAAEISGSIVQIMVLEKDFLLEYDDNMTFRRDWVRPFSVCCKVVVPPQDFRLFGTWRKSWRPR